ncbi:hypothetical protein C8F04DRAFT_1291718 [Mycena alexandri]|uniref:Uncharacterized protein n=1 Tax=Mycena alexandri TaxID=1745969 RepID=A0AAD6SHD7_9AGAR|nr:hypothetical protein C8F04DRAFT_1291718 [Mycena alexandri]
MSLPSHVEQSTPKLTKYVVQSSDVLEDLRVNVMRRTRIRSFGSRLHRTQKERFLEDEEIIEHLVHRESQRICWTMHRPRNGWYIRIRAPSFPPARRSARARPTTAHSYPPTPPVVVVYTPPTPTPASVQARLLEQRRPPNAQVVTQFVLAPYTIGAEALKPEEMGFFQRALRAIRSQAAGPSYSFTLARAPAPSPLPTLAPPAESTVALAAPPPPPVTAPPPPPLLTFHDRTPLTTLHAVTGLIEIDTAEEQRLGVEGSFWVAVALTYLEFLQEKESYLAALSD